MNRSPTLSIRTRRALAKLGADIRVARKRRRLTITLLADRARVSRTTVGKIERGDPGTGIGFYASVLMVLGMIDRLAELADAAHDELGLAIAEEELPERVRLPKSQKRGEASDG